MGPIKLKISTRRQAYFAGGVVQGNVDVEVSTKNHKESSADGLKLRLVGQTKTKVNDTTSEDAPSNETIDFLSHDVQLASFGGKAASGVHTFPFSVILPVDLPPSLMEGKVGGGGCSIQYSFTAHLHRPGLLNSDTKATFSLIVLGPPQQAGAAVPVLVEPVTQPVTSYCFFNRGSMSLGFRMERWAAGRQDPLDLIIAVRNDSPTQATALKIELKQECCWSAKGQRDKITRTIASVVVPGSEFGKLNWAPGTGSDRGQSVAPVEENPRSDLKQKLAAGSGVRFQLVIPGNCLLSIQSTNVTVTHSVGVMLVTPGCRAAPCVWAPLSVAMLPVAAAPEAQPGAPSLVPPQTLPNLPRHIVPPQTLPDLPRYSAGPYGSAPPAPYPNDNPTSGMTYGSAPPAPYPNNPPPSTTYGSAPGFVPDMQYRVQQPMPYATALQMDA